jgi:hypothetical protein
MADTRNMELSTEEVHLIASRRLKAVDKHRRTSKINQLREALKAFILREIETEASGDAGSWDVEEVAEVVEARRVLALTDPHNVKAEEVPFGV